jgi:hypothetical protein
MKKYQNYKHHKLPITTNLLEFGKLIHQEGNKYIMQLDTNNVIVINQIDNEYYCRFFRKGDLIFEFRDTIVSENSFIRTIYDTRFTFKDSKLITTEILNLYKSIKIFEEISSINNNINYYDSLKKIIIVILIVFY